MNMTRTRLVWLACLAVCCASLGVPQSAPGAEKQDSGMARMDDAKFQELAANAKAGCPVSKALASVNIKLNAKLIG